MIAVIVKSEATVIETGRANITGRAYFVVESEHAAALPATITFFCPTEDVPRIGAKLTIIIEEIKP